MQNRESHSKIKVVCCKCGVEHTVITDCGDRTCPFCQAKRRTRIIGNYTPMVHKMKNPWFITLTLVRSQLTPELLKSLRNMFTKLRHRKFWGKSKGFYQIEVGTVKGNTANLHIHTIVDWRGGELIDFLGLEEWEKSGTCLSEEWEDITKNSWIVDSRPCFNPYTAISLYLTGHMSKRIGFPKDEKLINWALKGSRLVQGYGWTKKERKKRPRDMVLGGFVRRCVSCGARNSLVSEYDVLYYDVLSAFMCSQIAQAI